MPVVLLFCLFIFLFFLLLLFVYNTQHTECPAGLYSTEIGAVSINVCVGCPPGTYSSATGLTSPDECINCAAGKKNPNDGSNSSAACEDCLANTKAAEEGSSQCTSCGVGEKSQNGSLKCTKCDAGDAGTGTNGACEPCLPGQYRSSDMKASACLLCPVGWGSSDGSTKCQTCDKGKFSAKEGSDCKNCPEKTFQDTSESTLCRACPTGWYQPDEGSRTCISLNYKTPSDCNDVQYLNDTSTDPNDWDCVECPDGASCAGNINWEGVQAKFGWSRCHNNNAAFERCTFPAACLGGTNPALVGKYFLDDTKKIDLADCNSGNCTARCNTAYVNASLMCGQCAHDYSHDGLTGRCDKCPPVGANIGVAIGGGLLGVLGLIVYIFITLSDGGHLDESDGAKSIGLSFIQLISLLVTFPIAW